jgi:hypothetical protein
VFWTAANWQRSAFISPLLRRQSGTLSERGTGPRASLSECDIMISTDRMLNRKVMDSPAKASFF